jgi:hypothetical protein
MLPTRLVSVRARRPWAQAGTNLQAAGMVDLNHVRRSTDCLIERLFACAWLGQYGIAAASNRMHWQRAA